MPRTSQTPCSITPRPVRSLGRCFTSMVEHMWANGNAEKSPAPRSGTAAAGDRNSASTGAHTVRCVRARRSNRQPSVSQRNASSVGHEPRVVGRLGKELDVEAGRSAAYIATLNVLAVAKQHLGSLDRVSRVVRLGVSIATPGGDFLEQPKVADAASELLHD